MKTRIIVFIALIVALIMALGIFKIALGAFKAGVWVGIILVVVLVGFVAFKLTQRKNNNRA